MRFPLDKSTRDQLFIIRQIMEKNWEHGLHLHMLFVYFKQAFDSVNRRKLLETMNVTGIPQTVIRLTEMTMKDMNAVVTYIHTVLFHPSR